MFLSRAVNEFFLPNDKRNFTLSLKVIFRRLFPGWYKRIKTDKWQVILPPSLPVPGETSTIVPFNIWFIASGDQDSEIQQDLSTYAHLQDWDKSFYKC